MQIPVLLEPISGNQFRASSGEPLKLEAEAPARAEALRKIRELIERRVAAGAEVVGVDIAPIAHPLEKFAGIFRNDPLVEDWKRAIAEYRQEREDDAETP